MMREASDTYIPPNYIIDDARENILAHLKSILEKDRREELKGIPNYKEIRDERDIWEMWTYLDTQTKQAVEAALIDTEGKLLGMKEEEAGRGIASPLRICTELTDYLHAREETGEVE
jgi:hypothetical protein